MKFKVSVILIIISVIIAGGVSAADPLYRMTNPAYFPGDQDAMILAKIISIEPNNYKISVLKIFNGSLSDDTILAEKNFTYLGFSEDHANPQVGDFCIMAVKKYDDIYKVRFPDRVVKANSGEYITLKCLYEDIHWGASDVAAVQWYANSGGTENGFAFSSGKVYVDRPNGERVDITDIAIAVSYDQSGNPVYSEPSEYETVNPRTQASTPYVALSFILLLFGCFFIKLSMTDIKCKKRDIIYR